MNKIIQSIMALLQKNPLQGMILALLIGIGGTSLATRAVYKDRNGDQVTCNLDKVRLQNKVDSLEASGDRMTNEYLGYIKAYNEELKNKIQAQEQSNQQKDLIKKQNNVTIKQNKKTIKKLNDAINK